MTLRPYQISALDSARAAVTAGHRASLLVAPTGSGKTRIGAAIVSGALARGRRVLWLAHRRELVTQAAEAINLPCGIISASSTVEANPGAPLQVASIQTLQARNIWPAADLVIIDEAHHAPTDAFGSVLARYADAVRIGLTATPQRADGVGLGAMFTKLIEVARVSDLIRDGYLVPCDVMAPSGAMRPGQIAQRPVDAYVKHTPGQSAIVYAPTLSSARTFTDQFLTAGIRCELVDGTTAADVRRDALAAFADGTLPVIVNVGVLTEGTDLPRCAVVIIARACGTLGLYLQIVGRALRPFPGKQRAVVIDLRGVSHEHGHPTEDRVYSLDGTGIRRPGEAGSEQAYCRVCGAPIMLGTGCDECGATVNAATPLRVVNAPLAKYQHLKNPDTAAKTLATLVQRYGTRRGRAIYRSMLARAAA